MENNELGLAPVPEELSVSDVYGTIVNNVEPAPTQWDNRVKELESPVKVTLKLPTSLVARLERVAADSKQTLDEWVTDNVIESIDGKVGQAVIKNPSWARTKVTGYTGSATRVDNNA